MLSYVCWRMLTPECALLLVETSRNARLLTYAYVSAYVSFWRMLTYAHVCIRKCIRQFLTYAHVCSRNARLLTYAYVSAYVSFWRMLTYADVRCRMLTQRASSHFSDTSAYVRIRKCIRQWAYLHTSAYDSIRQHTYVSIPVWQDGLKAGVAINIVSFYYACVFSYSYYTTTAMHVAGYVCVFSYSYYVLLLLCYVCGRVCVDRQRVWRRRWCWGWRGTISSLRPQTLGA